MLVVGGGSIGMGRKGRDTKKGGTRRKRKGGMWRKGEKARDGRRE